MPSAPIPVRSLRTLLALAVAGAAACSGPGPEKPLGDDDDDTDVTDTQPPPPETGCDTGCETGVEPAFFDVAFFHVEADIGWSAVNNGLIDIGTPNGDIVPSIVLFFGSPDWELDAFAFDSPAFCLVFLPLTDSNPAPFLADQPTMFWGVDYDVAAGTSGDCNTDGYLFDPAVWGDDPVADYASAEWGVAMGEINDHWGSVYAGGPYEALVFGGQIQNLVIANADGQLDYYAYGRAIDADNQVLIDQDSNYTLIDAGDVFLGATIESAWYSIVTNAIWQFE